MKSVIIYSNVSIAEDILDIFKRVGVENYTQWPRIVGVGPVTGPRLDSHVWPGANVGFQTIVEDAIAESLMDALQVFRDSEAGKQSGVYAFQTSVERALT